MKQKLKGKNFTLEVSDDSDEVIISGIALPSFNDEDGILEVSDKTINDNLLIKIGRILSGYSISPTFSPRNVIGKVTERKITKEGYWITGTLDKQQELVQKLISGLQGAKPGTKYRLGIEGMKLRENPKSRKIIKVALSNICILSEN